MHAGMDMKIRVKVKFVNDNLSLGEIIVRFNPKLSTISVYYDIYPEDNTPIGMERKISKYIMPFSDGKEVDSISLEYVNCSASFKEGGRIFAAQLQNELNNKYRSPNFQRIYDLQSSTYSQTGRSSPRNFETNPISSGPYRRNFEGLLGHTSRPTQHTDQWKEAGTNYHEPMHKMTKNSVESDNIVFNERVCVSPNPDLEQSYKILKHHIQTFKKHPDYTKDTPSLFKKFTNYVKNVCPTIELSERQIQTLLQMLRNNE